MVTNETLKNKIQSKFHGQKFSMVRYTYILECIQGEILLLNSKKEDFPGQTFFKKWEIFSDSYYFGDLFENDHLEMAKEVIKQKTGLDVSAKNINTIDLYSFKHVVNYNDIILNVFPINEDVTRELTFLNIYYYVKKIDTRLFDYISDRDDLICWLEKREALDKISIYHDKQVIANILANNVQGLFENED